MTTRSKTADSATSKAMVALHDDDCDNAPPMRGARMGPSSKGIMNKPVALCELKTRGIGSKGKRGELGYFLIR